VPDLDERLEHLIGGLVEPVEAEGAVERVRGRMVRHRRQRRLVAGGALVAVAAVAVAVTQVVSSPDRDRDRVITNPSEVTTTTSAPAPSTTVTVPAPDPSAVLLAEATSAWPSFVATLPAGTVSSEVAMSVDGPVAVTGGGESNITLYRYTDAAWSQLTRFDTVLPLAPDYALKGHIAVEEVTGDGQADFVALDFPGADHVGGSVLSEVGGQWHLVAFGSDGTYVTFLSVEDAANRARYGSVLQTLENDCTPDCATGTTSENHWRFDAGRGTFVSVDRHVWQPPTSTTPQPR